MAIKKDIIRYFRYTRYTAYVRTAVSGRGHAHACVPVSLRSFIQTHIDLVVRHSQNVRGGAGGGDATTRCLKEGGREAESRKDQRREQRDGGISPENERGPHRVTPILSPVIFLDWMERRFFANGFINARCMIAQIFHAAASII